MKTTLEDILNQIKTVIPDDTSDDALSLIENVTDTFTSFEKDLKESGDWKTKYEQNDSDWRTKYRDRFFTPNSDPNSEPIGDENDEPDDNRTLDFNDLFKEE